MTLNFANMNWVDYVILIIFTLSVLSGFARGLVKEVLSLITIIAAFIVATLFANSLAVAFANSASVQSAVGSMGSNAAQPASYLAVSISFAVLFAGTVIAGAIISYLINIAFQAGVLGIGNRILGAVFGFCRAFIIILAMIFVIQLTPFSDKEAWKQSQLVGNFQPAVVWLAETVSPALSDLKEKFSQTLQN